MLLVKETYSLNAPDSLSDSEADALCESFEDVRDAIQDLLREFADANGLEWKHD